MNACGQHGSTLKMGCDFPELWESVGLLVLFYGPNLLEEIGE